MLHVWQSKITKRYLLLTLVVILFTLTLLYVLTVRVMNASVQEQIEHRDDLIARTLSKRIGFLLEKMVDDMRVASNYLTKTSKEDKAFYLSEMQRLVSRDPLYLFIQAFDQEGRLLERIPNVPFSSPNDIGPIYTRLSWSKTYYISNMIILPDGRKTIAVAYPSLDGDGRFLGGTIAYLNLNTLSDYLNELRIGQEGINAVIDRDGWVLAHSGYEESTASTIATHPVGEFLRKERYGLWEGELFGQQMIVAYRPLSKGGLGLIVGETQHQSMEPSYHVMSVLLQGFLVVLLIAVGLGLFGTTRIVKPILDLTTQVKEYKENKRKRFRPIRTNDELQELSLVLGQMAKELTDKERRLFYILESIPYGIITTDKNGRITTFNKGAEELTLFTREEAIGKYIIDLPLKENKEEYVAWKTLQEGKAFDEIESYILDKEGNRHEVRMYSSLFPGEENEIIGAITIIRDVSEMKKLEEYAKQSERLASLGQLTAGIAHEIKNPLSIILAAAEAIKLECTDHQSTGMSVAELTDDILDSAERMNNLLADFLKLSKDETDSNKAPVDLVELLNELLHLLRKKCSDQGILVLRRYEADSCMVYGDKNRLTQVFLNILLNSIQAMESGGNLTVRIRDIGQNWEVTIEDSGKGIPAAKLPWIFNPFFSTKREGTGLGLSIAHEIVLQHNGKIYATSEEGKGTCLYVLIPKAEVGM
ncbi:PAS domain S-box protein [Brevibacillus sp. SYP-B805]|uniref:PAS domain-containing sensor histidine kinase n=1 Tax=Brevibacillus sp. SYP-B805 TaxID=1578199 RepID=UPI0013EB41A9|nr:PAS domain-containing sensor histidine kinase [Brevibacillus sp. SYP-B805]NGQ94975.1 PAS domain S-box protein [Brevibacillus sp. SYP-B805]